MGTLPEYGWLHYAPSSSAIGADRRLPLAEREGNFAVPSTFAFSDFLIDLSMGRSEHAARFSKADVLNFMESKWYMRFASNVPSEHFAEALERSEYWECSEGHEPKFLIYSGEQRDIPAIQRLRPVDILDMWVRAPHTLDILFPINNSWMNTNAVGYRSDLSVGRASCGVCGKTSEGHVRIYKAGRSQAHDLSHGLDPITLDYIISSCTFDGIYPALRAADKANVSLSAITEYLVRGGFSKESFDAITDDSLQNYSTLTANGWDGSVALLAVSVSGWFDANDRGEVELALGRQNGSHGFDTAYVFKLLDSFKKLDNRNGKFFVKALDEDLDPAIVESMLKPLGS